MNQTFTYRQKFSWSFVFLGLAGLAGLIYTQSGPFDITFRHKTLLEYPTSKYVVIGAGVLFILYAVHELLKMKAINSAKDPVRLTENELTFSHVAGYSAKETRVSLLSVTHLRSEADDDDGESLVLQVESGKTYAFFAENFESLSLFADFKKALEDRCQNNANRKELRPVGA